MGRGRVSKIGYLNVNSEPFRRRREAAIGFEVFVLDAHHFPRETPFPVMPAVAGRDARRRRSGPKAGSISFVSPVARLLMGKTVGDVVGASGQEFEIIAIS
jgi:hypothetical protein